MSEPDPNVLNSGTRVTLRDIARKAGVSHVTVSRALRGDPAVLSARREEILRIAQAMGYAPDPGLAALAAYRFHRQSAHAVRGTIGWLNAWDDPATLRRRRMFDAYWRGSDGAATHLGYHLEEIRWPSAYPAHRIEQILQARGIAGLLVPPQPPGRVWTDFAWNKFSAVCLGNLPDIPAMGVGVDNFGGVQMAIQKMHAHGYRRIGLVVNMHFDDLRQGCLYGGFKVAQRQLRLRPALPTFDTGTPGPTGHSEKTKARLGEWMRRHRPDALLTHDAYLPALLGELGWRVPTDVALAGTNIYDLPIDAGIAYDAETIGAVAVETLVREMISTRCDGKISPAHVYVKSRWQDGKSLPVKKSPLSAGAI